MIYAVSRTWRLIKLNGQEALITCGLLLQIYHMLKFVLHHAWNHTSYSEGATILYALCVFKTTLQRCCGSK